MNKALLHLYEPVAFHLFHERAFEAAAMLVRHDFTAFSAMNPATRTGETFLSVAAFGPLSRVAEHSDELYRMPGMAGGAFYSTDAPTSLHDYMPLDAFKGSVIYEFLYKELDLLYDLNLNFYAYSNGAFCQLGLARKRKFSEEERRLLHFFQPHLRQRYRQLLAGNPRDPLTGRMALQKQHWLICDAAGKIKLRSPDVSEAFAQIGLSPGAFLPAEWMPWFRSQSRDAGIETLPRPFVVERPRRRLTIHCLPNRISGEHRLVLEPMSPDALTRREREIAQWMAEGKTNSEIGRILGLSPFTVKNHVQKILTKLGVENRTSAAAMLLTSGQIDG